MLCCVVNFMCTQILWKSLVSVLFVCVLSVLGHSGGTYLGMGVFTHC